MEDPGTDELRLPFDIPTILAALRRKPWRYVIILAIAAAAGVAGGVLLGERTFETETVLRFTPVGDHATAAHVALQTEVNQVKITQNLAKARARLALTATLDELGSAVQIRTGKDSSLMIIRALWSDGPTASAIANTVRDIYLEEWVGSQVVKVRRLYDQAAAELKTLDSQAQKLTETLEDLQQRAEVETQEASKQPGNVGFKFQRLQSVIQEDQTRRANMAELARLGMEMERSKRLRQQDLISPAEHERTMAAFKSQQAVTVDTGRIRAWKNELDVLAQQLAQGGGTSSPTLSLLHATLLRSFEMDLQRVAAREKTSDLSNALDMLTEARARSAIIEGPGVGAGAGTGLGETPSTQSLQQTLTRVLSTYGADGGIFEIVAEAENPIFPSKSTRRLLALVFFLGIGAVGFSLIAAYEVFNPALRSVPEIRARLGLPTLGFLPQVEHEELVLPLKPGSEYIEATRLLAQRIRSIAPKKGLRLCITSAGIGDGRSIVTSHLAAALGLRGEKVLLIDAEVREPRSPKGLEFLSPLSGDNLPGLTDLLIREGTPLAKLTVKTSLAWVQLLPRGRAIKGPEPLGATTMGNALDDASTSNDIVLIKAAPALPYVDASVIARWCDGIILVARAGRTSASQMGRAVRRLETSGTPVLGVILVGVPLQFQNLD
jgi:Mrp family chromosome partitioning ATPase